MYEVEYPDGHKASLATNAIKENMFEQLDDEGNLHVLFDAITDHRTDGSEVKQQDAFIHRRNGTQRRKVITQGWEILVQWKDESTTWIALKDMKNSYPIQLCHMGNAKANRRRASIWLVYTAHVERTKPDHLEPQGKVLSTHSQV